MPSAFPAIDELLLNPVVAAAVIVIAVNVISYALSFKPTWLAIAVALAYMVGGYLVTGRTTAEELFLAVVYALLIISPLAHVDGAVLNKLFGNGGRPAMRIVGDEHRMFFQPWL